MSQPVGGEEAIPRIPSPGSLKRKRDAAAHASSTSTSSPGGVLNGAKLTNGAPPPPPPASRPLHPPSSDLQGTKQYHSPDSDETQPSESGDLLRGLGSASSLTSTASSVFSNNNNASAHTRHVSTANGLTPLTSHTDSSPAKGNSPHVSADMAARNGAFSIPSSHGPLASAHTPDLSAPPLLERRAMLPPPGKAKGYRVVWDPELDGKLSKEERKRATPRKKEFGTEVRYITFHHLLSLHNNIRVTWKRLLKSLCTLSLTTV